MLLSRGAARSRRGWKRWRGRRGKRRRRRRDAAAGPVPVPERGGRCGASLAASPPSPAGNMAAAAQDELSKCSRRRDSRRGRAGGRPTRSFPAASPQQVSSAVGLGPRPGRAVTAAGPDRPWEAISGSGNREQRHLPHPRLLRGHASCVTLRGGDGGSWPGRSLGTLHRLRGSGLRPPLLYGHWRPRLCPSVLSPCAVRLPSLNHSSGVNTTPAGPSRGGFAPSAVPGGGCESASRPPLRRSAHDRRCRCRRAFETAELGPAFLSSPKPFLRDSGKAPDQLAALWRSLWNFKKSGFSSLAFPGLT